MNTTSGKTNPCGKILGDKGYSPKPTQALPSPLTAAGWLCETEGPQISRARLDAFSTQVEAARCSLDTSVRSNPCTSSGTHSCERAQLQEETRPRGTGQALAHLINLIRLSVNTKVDFQPNDSICCLCGTTVRKSLTYHSGPSF